MDTYVEDELSTPQKAEPMLDTEFERLIRQIQPASPNQSAVFVGGRGVGPPPPVQQVYDCRVKVNLLPSSLRVPHQPPDRIEAALKQVIEIGAILEELKPARTPVWERTREISPPGIETDLTSHRRESVEHKITKLFGILPLLFDSYRPTISVPETRIPYHISSNMVRGQSLRGTIFITNFIGEILRWSALSDLEVCRYHWPTMIAKFENMLCHLEELPSRNSEVHRQAFRDSVPIIKLTRIFSTRWPNQ
ncbi:hypothetical protein Pst134EA_020831 [Puccinia striiformis f. sp. tritici]|uniref:hypothetical protein n=1 Tax=Puccinia striiformis f. sp. tritici TaxID=168172 RepID=UPI0020081ED6|nr:hypothetical protein Pst134EA_020831 [Puccinia striiformis f. sp. tritici]KAH9456923.1 hypothetical protein Pst134EA_020831 [Puccinia striiformis f. sp. tritici]